MAVLTQLKRDWHFLRTMLRVGGRIRSAAPDMTVTVADIIEGWARDTPDAPAILFEDRSFSYRDYDAAANRFAVWAQDRGLVQGDVVALLMENRPEFLFVWLGMAKIGVTTALINTNLRGQALLHSLSVSDARHLIVGEELADAVADIGDDLPDTMSLFRLADAWAHDPTGRTLPAPADRPALGTDLDAVLAGQAEGAIGPQARSDLRGRDACFYIYTSGTTGLPKAAKFPHMRVFSGMNGFSAAVDATAKDRMYVTLPLYHSAGGVCAVGVTLSVGGSIVLKRKFSASHFWEDVVKYRATLFQYIGELCLYLLIAPPHPQERDHALRAIIVNGLRPEIWEAFQARFAIPRIVEFYGSTEGNVMLFNYDGKPGAVGRVPSYARRFFNVDLVRFNLETEEPQRNAEGFCIPCGPEELGEALGRIGTDARHHFDGYSGSRETDKKVLHHVFKDDDAYFRTGDLLRRDAHGYYYFVDRVGDTFRWKGENVATSEVAGALSRFPDIHEASVYGVRVPHADGRAGMAALTADTDLDLAALFEHALRELPAYACPVFLRLRGAIDVTGTFKHRKVDLVEQGFDPGSTNDPIFIRDDGLRTFRPLTIEEYEEIRAGRRSL
ncbi:MAG: long-chain-acyl-CoA synthetase [Alphaproteobacteria bacterium]